MKLKCFTGQGSFSNRKRPESLKLWDLPKVLLGVSKGGFGIELLNAIYTQLTLHLSAAVNYVTHGENNTVLGFQPLPWTVDLHERSQFSLLIEVYIYLGRWGISA